MRFFRHGRMEKNCVPDGRLHIFNRTTSNRTVHVSLPYWAGRENVTFRGNNLINSTMHQGIYIIFTFRQKQTLKMTMEKQ